MDENPFLFWKTHVQFEHLKKSQKPYSQVSSSQTHVLEHGVNFKTENGLGLLAIRRIPLIKVFVIKVQQRLVLVSSCRFS